MELAPDLPWALWLLFEEAVRVAPREPGVYVARERSAGLIVYIGMVGGVPAVGNATGRSALAGHAGTWVVSGMRPRESYTAPSYSPSGS